MQNIKLKGQKFKATTKIIFVIKINPEVYFNILKQFKKCTGNKKSYKPINCSEEQ